MYIGKQLGRYTMKHIIGKGRYGVCYYAESADGDGVVIKRFKPGMFRRNKDKNAFEAVILSKLRDQRIPELLGIINQKGFYGFVLEYKRGCTLKELLRKDKRIFTAEEVYQIGCGLISIIKYIHEAGVVHRDIRTPNVLLDNGEVYLIDFGLARWAECGRYPYNQDYSYLADLLLHLLYSSFTPRTTHQKLPWYDELPLTNEQKLFLKRLFGIEDIYESIDDIEADFCAAFGKDGSVYGQLP